MLVGRPWCFDHGNPGTEAFLKLWGGCWCGGFHDFHMTSVKAVNSRLKWLRDGKEAALGGVCRGQALAGDC